MGETCELWGEQAEQQVEEKQAASAASHVFLMRSGRWSELVHTSSWEMQVQRNVISRVRDSLKKVPRGVGNQQIHNLFPFFILMLIVEIFFAKQIKTTDRPNSQAYHIKWKRVTWSTGMLMCRTAACMPLIVELMKNLMRKKAKSLWKVKLKRSQILSLNQSSKAISHRKLLTSFHPLKRTLFNFQQNIGSHWLMLMCFLEQ